MRVVMKMGFVMVEEVMNGRASLLSHDLGSIFIFKSSRGTG